MSRLARRRRRHRNVTSFKNPPNHGARPERPQPPLAFTAGDFDRASTLRQDPEAVRRLLLEGEPLVLCGTASQVLAAAGDPPRLLRMPLQGDAVKLAAAEAPILLGIENGQPLLAVDLGDDVDLGGSGDADGGRLLDLRRAGALLSPQESGLAAFLVALLGWHRRHRFCPNCGNPTEVREAGTARRCPSCGRIHFPRTDPCVITLVQSGERILLGSRSGWPDDRFSVIAGYVAASETPEAAVRREVLEETGVQVTALRYVTSQPWPFPRSLMIGFEAQGEGEPQPRDGELTVARWFTRDEVRQAQADKGPIHLPDTVSIARWLIDGWVARSR
jgi:NAD+ diphosphatase